MSTPFRDTVKFPWPFVPLNVTSSAMRTGFPFTTRAFSVEALRERGILAAKHQIAGLDISRLRLCGHHAGFILGVKGAAGENRATFGLRRPGKVREVASIGKKCGQK